uniref:Uncharacterized protein n=1 Tax=Branchiostoma floridae TaxID=7739 RepID=C3Y9Q5_BRAFL|eukprot:XP_002607301.1 hypothetical protein BRAFLDRAFT_88251 [Branchiostoma floridae]
MGLPSIPQNLPPCIHTLDLKGSNTKATLHNTNTAAIIDNRYEDMNQHNQTCQNQSQAIIESSTNTTAAVLASGYNHRYENMNQHDQTGQGQSQPITESNTNTTAAVVASGSDHQYEYINQHKQTGQGQSQTTTKSLGARNQSYDTGPTTSQLNSLYKAGQIEYQPIIKPNTNTTAAVVTIGDDQAEQGQSQFITTDLVVGNLSHNDILAALQPNPMYTVILSPNILQHSTNGVVLGAALDFSSLDLQMLNTLYNCYGGK